MQMQPVPGSSGHRPVQQLDALQAGLPGTAVGVLQGGLLPLGARLGSYQQLRAQQQQQFQQQQQAHWMPASSAASTGQGYALLGGADAEALLALSGGNPVGLPEFSNDHQQLQQQQLQLQRLQQQLQQLEASDAAAAMPQLPEWVFEPQNQVMFQAAARAHGSRPSAAASAENLVAQSNSGFMATGFNSGPPSQGSLSAAAAAGQLMTVAYGSTVMQAQQQQQLPAAQRPGMQRMYLPSSSAAHMLGMQHVRAPSAPLAVPGSHSGPLFYMPASPAGQGLLSATLSSVEPGAGAGLSTDTLQGLLHQLSMYDVQVQEL
jgi:hypothetical protein